MCSISSLLLVFIMWTICFMKTHTSFDIYELNQMQNEKKKTFGFYSVTQADYIMKFSLRYNLFRSVSNNSNNQNDEMKTPY